ncbi:MAG: DUF2232 domain-containing protein, partial [Clostridia bacterium]
MEQTYSHGKTGKEFVLLLLVSVLLLLCGCYVPVLGTLVTFVWAVPVCLAVFRCGIAASSLLAAFLAGLSFILMGPYDGIVTAGTMAFLGLFYGIRLKEKASPGMTLFWGILIAALIEGLYLWAVWKFGGVSFADFQSSFEAYMTEIYSDASVAELAVAEGMSAAAYARELSMMMAQILPSFYFISVMIVAVVNYLAAQAYLKKKAVDAVFLPVFAKWHLPWWILWGIVLALILLVAGNGLHLEFLTIAAKNIFVCFAPFFLIAGISLLRYYFVKWRLSGGIQI